MNHDYSHCSDWNPDMCPESCFRAKITKDLKENSEKYKYGLFSYAHFKGTSYCTLVENSQK